MRERKRARGKMTGGGKVDLALIKEATRLDLVNLLDSIPGTKVR